MHSARGLCRTLRSSLSLYDVAVSPTMSAKLCTYVFLLLLLLLTLSFNPGRPAPAAMNGASRELKWVCLFSAGGRGPRQRAALYALWRPVPRLPCPWLEVRTRRLLTGPAAFAGNVFPLTVYHLCGHSLSCCLFGCLCVASDNNQWLQRLTSLFFFFVRLQSDYYLS